MSDNSNSMASAVLMFTDALAVIIDNHGGVRNSTSSWLRGIIATRAADLYEEAHRAGETFALDKIEAARKKRTLPERRSPPTVMY